MPLTIQPIKFGTDGWRGLIAADFTFERVAIVAPLAAKVLADNYSDYLPESRKRSIIVGYDRRFMAEEFAKVAAEALKEAGFDVLLSNTSAPTPALSWAAKSEPALGAIVITASHNPAYYSGLKVKGTFGGSVSPEITGQIEAALDRPQPPASHSGKIELFDPWPSYCEGLKSRVNIEAIADALATGKLAVYADVMHGAAASGLYRLLGEGIKEINGDRDPLFGGNPPEPLPRYASELFRVLKTARQQEGMVKVGFVFDGDGDRIAAVDGGGNFLSSQVLIPILLDHLANRRKLKGEIVKTLSGSDLIPLLARLYDLPVFETPVGYKYIAERMLTTDVLIGGEESGGIGYGTHIPERDALLSALYLLEAIVESQKDLGELYAELQKLTNFNCAYDRIDLPLANMEVRARLLERLQQETPEEIAGNQVVECTAVDGYKLRAADGSWLLIRFSGTEPVLRLYCEAPDMVRVRETLSWAKEWADRP